MNYDELNRFTKSLTYSIRRFIFLPWPKGDGTMHLHGRQTRGTRLLR